MKTTKIQEDKSGNKKKKKKKGRRRNKRKNEKRINKKNTQKKRRRNKTKKIQTQAHQMLWNFTWKEISIYSRETLGSQIQHPWGFLQVLFTIITPWGLMRLQCYNLCKSNIQASQKRDTQVGNTVPRAMKMPLTYFWTALYQIYPFYADVNGWRHPENFQTFSKNLKFKFTIFESNIKMCKYN